MSLLRKSHRKESLRGGPLSAGEMIRGGFPTVDQESIKGSLMLALMFFFRLSWKDALSTTYLENTQSCLVNCRVQGYISELLLSPLTLR